MKSTEKERWETHNILRLNTLVCILHQHRALLYIYIILFLSGSE